MCFALIWPSLPLASSLTLDAACLLLLRKQTDLLDPKLVEEFLVFAASATLPDSNQARFEAIYPMAARALKGLEVFQEDLLARSKPGDWEFHSSQASEQSLGALILETLREQFYVHLNKELPYTLKQRIEEVSQVDGQLNVLIQVTTRSQSQLRIVIGKQGAMLRRMVQAAEARLRDQTGKSITLRVKLAVASHPK
ncbi:uncharacterized protein MONBRDRAFT_28766 [Monosiga brevicollis MX1]|uniref:KH type-2 domain-containing protein n=1 Tax=Monosiga brevicollis TaxID=81824 RepID=A9V947_MONBE|nr:uncharacterized protein MONBRDRAFT_28766 [Monosiga brevicollis MX1]EDQ85992.1 predicted protein [Monosiga brevicollis MX1]|eukprot:XP_001749186.1 hypothetical protein [Monosiga brevicollis MX1]